MMKQPKNLYNYLEPYLEHGTEAEIAAARKKYWNQYKAAWRKQKRKDEKEYTISLNRNEEKIIAKAARSHTRSATRFIKEATIAYATNTRLATNPAALLYIRELLALHYNKLQQLTEEGKIRNDTGALLMEKFALLEKNILTRLCNHDH